MNQIQNLLYKKWETRWAGNVYLIHIIWFLLAAIAVSAEISRGLTGIDNYLIFEGVFRHVVQEKYLFSYYPDEYVSFNNYGPAFFIFSYVFTIRGKDWLATLFIALGFLTKLYGIAGLAFFFFSRNKLQFALSFIAWMAIIVVAPIVYSSADYIMQSYEDWYYQIIRRNQQNIDNSRTAGMQDISVPGMIRRIFHYYGPIDLPIIAVAGTLFGIPLLKKQNQQQVKFGLSYLALVLISVVIFSSAAESPTFVIAVTGAAIWFILQEKPLSIYVKSLLVLLFILTILSPTDLIPPYIRINIILAYSLKALPCFIIWCWLIISCWKIHLPKFPAGQ